MIFAKANFSKFAPNRAPLMANEDLMRLDPVGVITLSHSLDPARAEKTQVGGYARNLAQKALTHWRRQGTRDAQGRIKQPWELNRSLPPVTV